MKSYSLNDGHENWACRGLARVSNASPVAGDGTLIVSSWNVGGDEGARITMAPWDEFLAANDKNHDGVLTKDEFPSGPIKDRFSQIDVNKDGQVTREGEYGAYARSSLPRRPINSSPSSPAAMATSPTPT